MRNIISWYNKNRNKIKIWIIAILIAFVVIWRLMDLFLEKNKENSTGQLNQFDTNTLNSITLESQKSAISGEKIELNEEKMKTIDNFITYCNSGKVQDAYNMLSNECKEEMYQKIGYFQQRYYDKIFKNSKKTVSIQNWTENIYKVSLTSNILDMEIYSNDNNEIQDYYTIVTDNEGNYKLNINKYIGRTELNKSEISENVGIKILRKDEYMDYEKYTFYVKNNTEFAIALGDTSNTYMTYLTDENDLKYTAYTSELSQAEVAVDKKQARTITIKYSNAYSSNRKIKKLYFPTIILNYNSFLGYKYGENYKQTAIEFEL